MLSLCYFLTIDPFATQEMGIEKASEQRLLLICPDMMDTILFKHIFRILFERRKISKQLSLFAFSIQSSIFCRVDGGGYVLGF